MTKPTLYTAAILLSSPFAASSEAATQEELLHMLQEMKAQMAQQQEKIDALEAQLQAQTRETKTAQQETAKEEDDYILSLSPSLNIKSADGTKSFKTEGRLAVDIGWANDDEQTDLADATDIRRAWFGFRGNFDEYWGYRLTVGFDNDETNIQDAYLAYSGFDNTKLSVGHIRTLGSLDMMTSNLHTVFMERSSAVEAFYSTRRLGADARFHGNQWAAQFGIFGDSPDNTASDDEGHGVNGRLILQPLYEPEQRHILHVAGFGRYRIADASVDSTRFRERGEAHIINQRLVDTGTITGVDNWITYGAELMYQRGPLTLQSEVIWTDVNRAQATDPTFSGAYLQASYFFTGDYRNYRASVGDMRRVSVSDPFTATGPGWGAWEVAARYSMLDLSDGGITGGEMESTTLGLNWYPIDRVKLTANYIMHQVDHPNNDFGDPDYFIMRAQMDF